MMTNWFENIPELTLKGHIKVPYTWSVGEMGSYFLVALRDQKKILGNRCSQCRTVFVPPRKSCGKCFKEIDEWVEISDEGTVTAHTIIRYDHPIHSTPAPFAYAIIKLDGADVGFIHIIKQDLARLENGVRVKAKFSKNRKGHILDIDSFRII